MFQLPIIDTNQPQTIRGAAVELSDNIWMFLCSSVCRTRRPWLIHLTSDQFSIYPQTISDDLWSREDSSVSGWCSYVSSSLMVQIVGELC